MIIDCSIAVSSVLPDEASAYTDATIAFIDAREVIPHVPAIFHFEVANALWIAQRRKRISATQAEKYFLYWHGFGLHVDTSADMQAVRKLASRYDLTMYDAAYLELSLRYGSVLATLDAALLKAAHKEKCAFLA